MAALLVVAAAAVVALGAWIASLVLDDGDGSADTTVAADETSVPPSESAQPPAAPPFEGALVIAAVLSGDVLDISEVVTWPEGGPEELTLELPDLAAVSGLDEDFDPSITDLQVTLDGSPVEAAPVAGSTNVFTVQSPTGAPSTMEVRYLLDGAVIRSTPSRAGRGIAVVAPLTQSVLDSLPVRVEIPGATTVLNVSCPTAPDLASQLCGREDDSGWSADLPAGEPPVAVVQVDLATAA